MRGYSLPLYKTSRPTYQVRSFAYTTIADNLAYGTRLCSIGVVLPSRLTVLQGVVPASAERSVHSAKHASYAAHNQRSICENGFAVSARSRLTEMAAAAVLLVACGSAVPSSTFATTLNTEEITPVSRHALDRKLMLRFRHQCMPLLPASLDEQMSGAEHGQSEWPVSDEGKHVQTGRKLQERYRVPPPVCNSTGGGDNVMGPKKMRVPQASPRFAMAPRAVPTPVPLPVATLPSVALSLAEQPPADLAVPGKYVPGPVEVGWQIYVGSAVAAFPFVLGSYEFGKRILIQRRYARSL